MGINYKCTLISYIAHGMLAGSSKENMVLHTCMHACMHRMSDPMVSEHWTEQEMGQMSIKGTEGP